MDYAIAGAARPSDGFVLARGVAEAEPSSLSLYQLLLCSGSFQAAQQLLIRLVEFDVFANRIEVCALPHVRSYSATAALLERFLDLFNGRTFPFSDLRDQFVIGSLVSSF